MRCEGTLAGQLGDTRAECLEIEEVRQALCKTFRLPDRGPQKEGCVTTPSAPALAPIPAAVALADLATLFLEYVCASQTAAGTGSHTEPLPLRFVPRSDPAQTGRLMRKGQRCPCRPSECAEKYGSHDSSLGRERCETRALRCN